MDRQKAFVAYVQGPEGGRRADLGGVALSAILDLRIPAGIGALREVATALGAAETVAEAGSAVAGWAREAIPDAVVTIARPDASGKLRTAWQSDVVEAQLASWQHKQWQAAWGLRRSVGSHAPGGDDRFLGMFPLSHRGAAVGLLAALAAPDRLKPMWEVFEVIASHLGLALPGLDRPGPSRDEIGTSSRAAGDPIGPTSEYLVGPQDLGIAVSWTAHELRGPLVALKAVLGLLDTSERAPAQGALLDRCLAELDQMCVLIDDILRWSVGGEEPSTRTYDVVSIVEEAIERCTLELGERRVSLDAPARVIARVQPTHLRGAVANLIRNAFMYSPPGSSVEVHVRAEVDRISIGVRNDGEAIGPDEAERIFDPFVRGRNGAGHRGAGLGLFIARRVAEAHDGRLSAAVEAGSTEFRLDLPRGET